jgi:hypothetical protein
MAFGQGYGSGRGEVAGSSDEREECIANLKVGCGAVYFLDLWDN